MLAEARNGNKYEELLKRAVEHVEKRGFEEIKTNLDGYENPNTFSRQKKDTTYEPDITAKKNSGKFYFEIAQKTEDTTSMVSKWKLLATLGEMKNGALNILVPYGQNKFTQELVDQHNINANLIKLN